MNYSARLSVGHFADLIAWTKEEVEAQYNPQRGADAFHILAARPIPSPYRQVNWRATVQNQSGCARLTA